MEMHCIDITYLILTNFSIGEIIIQFLQYFITGDQGAEFATSTIYMRVIFLGTELRRFVKLIEFPECGLDTLSWLCICISLVNKMNNSIHDMLILIIYSFILIAVFIIFIHCIYNCLFLLVHGTRRVPYSNHSVHQKTLTLRITVLP